MLLGFEAEIGIFGSGKLIVEQRREIGCETEEILGVLAPSLKGLVTLIPFSLFSIRIVLVAPRS